LRRATFCAEKRAGGKKGQISYKIRIADAHTTSSIALSIFCALKGGKRAGKEMNLIKYALPIASHCKSFRKGAVPCIQGEYSLFYRGLFAK